LFVTDAAGKKTELMRFQPGLGVVKLFTVVIYEYSYKVRVLVPGKPLQTGLLFASKARVYW
jgi:hypothetical protein